ncbi:MAG TPA: hypothetical protein DIT64_17900 [Verrucomicrobiales bacterium]|nr:hypothetical protein [Verrucomicrobiales bacterium]
MTRFFLPLLALTAHGATCACTIPVFRYALDRWEADKFQLLLPTEAGPETADLLRPLRANGKANLTIQAVPGVEGEAVLRFPSRQEIWRGRLNAASLAALLDSPGRRRIVERVLAGDSVLWVVCGGEADTERIGKRLRFLEQVAALPIQDPNDPDSRLGPGPPLLLKFTTLRLEQDDPAEKLLRRMLAGPRAEFDAEKTPFAAAVFGRGRVLGAWPLAELDDQALEEASMFLIGRCSCRVKDQNPGWDLLLNVDWDQALKKAGQSAAAAPPESAPPQAPETVVTAAEPSEPQVFVINQFVPLPWLAGGAALVLGAGAWLLLRKAPKD